MRAARHWATLGEVTCEAGLWVMWGIYRAFGRIPFRIALYPVVAWYWALNPRARRASLQYLRRMQAAHGTLGHDPDWRDTVRHFAAFAETMLDKMLAVGGLYPFEQVEITGHAWVSAARRDIGGVIVTAHVGCLELCSALGAHHRPAHILVLTHTRHAERFNAILRRLNPHSRVQLMQVTEIDPGTAQRLAEHVASGGLVSIVGDRVPVHSGKTVAAPFLGVEAQFPVGAHVLAALLRCPLYFMACVRQGRGHRIVFESLAERVELPRRERAALLRHWVAAYAERLEMVLKLAPFEWFNFFAFWDQKSTDTTHET